MSHNSDMIKLVKLMEGKQQYAGEEVGQKPGDQVRGTDKAKVGGKDHPFKGRLVGEDTTLEDKLAKKYQDFKEIQAKEKEEKKKEEVEEAKQRLDPKCWDGYKKQGTKMKGGVRVNNCVPEGAEQDVTEGERTMSRAAKGHEKYGKEGMEALARAGREGAGEEQLDKIRDKHDKYASKEVKEGFLDHPGEEHSPVTQAITRRILLQRTDLLSKHGPERVAAAIDDVADFVGDVDEIGSSDVSGWVRHVEQMLGNMEEDAPALAKLAGGLGLGAVAAAGAPAIVGILGPLLGIPLAAYGAYSAAKLGMKGVEKLWDMAAQKLGGDDKVEQYTNAKIAKLPPDQARAAMQAVKQVAESRRSDRADRQLSELGATPPPAPTGTATGTSTTGNTAPTAGSVSPDEQTALNKIQTNPAMKQQLDRLMTQATPGAANKPMALNPEQEDALEKIKSNAGLKTQYDKIIKQANPQAKV